MSRIATLNRSGRGDSGQQEISRNPVGNCWQTFAVRPVGFPRMTYVAQATTDGLKGHPSRREMLRFEGLVLLKPGGYTADTPLKEEWISRRWSEPCCFAS